MNAEERAKHVGTTAEERAEALFRGDHITEAHLASAIHAAEAQARDAEHDEWSNDTRRLAETGKVQHPALLLLWDTARAQARDERDEEWFQQLRSPVPMIVHAWEGAFEARDEIEREACAKVAMGVLIEKAGNESVEIISTSIVAAIRARSSEGDGDA